MLIYIFEIMLNSTIIKFNYGRYVKEARIQSLDLRLRLPQWITSPLGS